MTNYCIRQVKEDEEAITERYGMAPPRIGEELNRDAVVGLLTLVTARIDETGSVNSFLPNARTADTTSLQHNQAKERACGLQEFSFEYLSFPTVYYFHSYWSHSHLKYDQSEGRAKFATDVNRIFERQGLAFELKEGEIIRFAPTGLQEALAETVVKRCRS